MKKNKYISEINQLLDYTDKFCISNMNRIHKYSMKGDRDFALEIDFAIESHIKEYIGKKFPNIPILGEETEWSVAQNRMPELFWVIDPIDGTVNYSKKIPEFGTCIALIKENKPYACGISFPLLNERYNGLKNRGAFLNGKKIKVSNNNLLTHSIIGYGDFAVKNDFKLKNKFRIELLEDIANCVQRVRMPGSAALQLAWLASGRIDLSITLSNCAWDVQAGILLVTEAGGEVFDYDGSEHNLNSRFTIASNNSIIKNRIIELVRNKMSETE